MHSECLEIHTAYRLFNLLFVKFNSRNFSKIAKKKNLILSCQYIDESYFETIAKSCLEWILIFVNWNTLLAYFNFEFWLSFRQIGEIARAVRGKRKISFHRILCRNFVTISENGHQSSFNVRSSVRFALAAAPSWDRFEFLASLVSS